jgi:cobalt-zinc-cadmium efflux system membrane fusion protein
MRILFQAARLAVLLAALVGPLKSEVLAHEGHDHGAPPPVTNVPSAPRAEASSDDHELVVVARAGKLSIYVDRFVTNEPVTDIEIEVETPAGPITARGVGEAYEIDAPWSDRPGSHDLIFTVTGASGVDILTTTLVIPGETKTVGTAEPVRPATAAAGLSQRLAGFDPVLMLAAGFLLGILLMLLARWRRIAAFAAAIIILSAAVLFNSGAMADTVAPQTASSASKPATRDFAQRLPDGSVFVPKPAQRLLQVRTVMTNSSAQTRTVELPGRVIPDPDASGYVQASVSGRLSPPAAGFPRLGTRVREGDILAYVTPPLTAAETSDQRQRQGELDQQINIVEQRIARFERLVPSGAVARVQLDEARLELQGLRDRRAALDRGRREPEALVAPVSGVVAAVNAIAGQIAEPNAIVFQIVDPARLWVEALSFEALSHVEQATGRTASRQALTLEYKGSGLSDRSQAIPVHFAITGDLAGLRIGQLVTVYVQNGEALSGIAVPRNSVLSGSNGQSVVYEHVTAERFEAREVRTIPLDAGRVLIAGGLNAGRRIVVQGAELLNQVR